MHINEVDILPNDEVDKNMILELEEEQFQQNHQHRLQSGEIRDVEVYTSVITYESKKFLYKIIIDRTETVKTNNEIEKINRRLHGLESIVHYQARSINDLLNFTLNEIIEYTNSEMGLLYHYDHEKRIFLLNNVSANA